MTNALNWFEIPVNDIDRAGEFYGAILDTEIVAQEVMGGIIGFLPAGEGGVGGALVQNAEFGYVPATTGTLVYLNGGADLDVVLGKVEAAGGQVLSPKTGIGENGFVAYFQDTEGNKVGLHSPG